MILLFKAAAQDMSIKVYLILSYNTDNKHGAALNNLTETNILISSAIKRIG